MMLHPYLAEAQARQRALLYPDGVIDYTQHPELAVVRGDVVEYKTGRSVYELELENGKRVKHERVTSFSRKWNKSEYGGPSNAATIGTDVHAAIEACLTGKAMGVRGKITCSAAAHCYDLFLDWWSAQEDWSCVVTEGLVFAWQPAVAGRLDCVLRHEDGRHQLVDFKSSNFMDQSYLLQMWLYAYCLSRIGVQIDRATILCLPKPEQGGQWIEHVLWDSQEPDSMVRRDQLGQVVFAMGTLSMMWPGLRDIINDSRREQPVSPSISTCPNCGAPVDLKVKPYVFLCEACRKSNWSKSA